MGNGLAIFGFGFVVGSLGNGSKVVQQVKFNTVMRPGPFLDARLLNTAR
jgi:hypothetical protein